MPASDTVRRLTLATAVVAATLLLLSGAGVRSGWWPYRTGFTLLRWAAYFGVAAGLAALVQVALARGRPAGAWGLVLAVALGALAFGVPYLWLTRVRGVPPIHDITTDTADPPEFVAVLPLRADASNPAAYGGPDIAAQQARAYPDIRPLELPSTPPDAAFRRALEAAQDAGWAIAAADSAAGRIEATATTRWFGFKDDVVVRVRPMGQGSRVDVRSVSRVGMSDVGTNARRIRAYLQALERTR